MRNLKILMSYNGSEYHGFQIQSNAVTIQGTVENALMSVLKEKINIIGCSRTDAGVHAKEYCFNFYTKNPIPSVGLKKALNSILPSDIVINNCKDVTLNFHARFCSVGKEYLYILRNSPLRDVFRKNLTLLYPYPIDVDSLNDAAQIFVGTHDFAAFCKAETKDKLSTTVREVTGIRIERNGEEIYFYISGKGFLHNMVRIIVGTLIYYAEGKRTCLDIENALKTGEREFAGVTVPPDGLYLNKVFYKG